MEKHLIVIGGTAAGLSAASKAKRSSPSLKVTVFEKSGFVSYGACGLPYFVGDEIKSHDELISLSASQLREKRDIDTYIHHEAEIIDPDNKTVTVKNLDTEEVTVHNYDYLVIATGALPILPDIRGINSRDVYVLRTVEDGISIKNRLCNNPQKVIIIGGGLIGLEVAEQLRQNKISVDLFEAMPRLLPFLNEDYSAQIKSTLEKNGVNVHTGAMAKEILTDNGKAVGIITGANETYYADLVIVSVGVVPNSSLAGNAGLQLGYKGGIAVDGHMQTSDSSIWACGDCVQMYNLITGKPTYIPMGTTANKQGRIAGENIVGENSSFSGVLASQVTKVFDLYIASSGLTLEQANAEGFYAASTKITKSDKASYYPGGRDNQLCLIFDSETGRLLGAQGIGSESVAGRINVLIAAITSKMTINQLNELDLLYSPSVAPVYDPILIAASQGIKQVHKTK